MASLLMVSMNFPRPHSSARLAYLSLRLSPSLRPDLPSVPEPPDPPDPPDLPSFQICVVLASLLTSSPLTITHLLSPPLTAAHRVLPSVFIPHRGKDPEAHLHLSLVKATPVANYPPPRSLKLVFPSLPLASLSCALQVAAHAVEFGAACSVFITPSSPSLHCCQVMHLYCSLSPITLYFAVDCIRMSLSGKFIALVRSLTAICRLFPNFTSNFGNMKSCLIPLWQIGLTNLLSFSPVKLVDFSFMEYVLLPKFPLGSSGVVARSLKSKVLYTSMLVLSSGSAIWCFVTFASSAEFPIVKSALVAISIMGIRALIVFYISQGFVSLFSTIGVKLRGPLLVFSGLSVVFAPNFIMFVSRLALVAAVVLAGLALLSFVWNMYSSDGE